VEHLTLIVSPSEHHGRIVTGWRPRHYRRNLRT